MAIEYDLASPESNDSVISLSLDAEIAITNTGSLDKNLVSLSMTGSLAVVNTATGILDVVKISGEGGIYSSADGTGAFDVLELSMDGSGTISNRLEMDSNLVMISMVGQITGESLSIDRETDADYPYFTGEEYLVVNLRTKVHSTYRDGDRSASAKLAALTFDTHTLKAVTDLFMLARAQGVAEVVIGIGEEKKRVYPIDYGQNEDVGLKNKRRKLAKGMLASTWEIDIVVPNTNHLELRGLDLIIHDTKRFTR